ncbi:Crp/Fnr family transcriptional regulator [Methylobacterium sp. SI9]|uniref:Crp/Fnr family transcriptional regulator n=1 Tax=Methylobacterium guangdongense TaxID=3138811 RepID=UPI00313A8BD9
MSIDDLDYNRVAPLFGNLALETISNLLPRQRPIALRPGDFIYQQGDPVDGICVLMPADVVALPQLVDVTWANQTTGRTLRLERIRAPAMLGYIEVVQSSFLLRHGNGGRRLGAARTRLTSAQAVTTLKLMHIPYSALERLSSDEATALAAILGRKAADAFAGSLAVLHDAFIDDSTYRLAAWLRQETAGSPYGGASGSTARTRPLKQQEIADQVGLGRETLNQKLKAMETGGIIAVLPSREIVVYDLERLDQLADLAIRSDFTTFDTARGTINDALLTGDAFRARNLALEVLGRFPSHPEIRHQAVLAMLRCGSFEEAAGLLATFGWDGDLDTVLSSIDDGYASPHGVKRRDELDSGEQLDADEEKRWWRDRQKNERRLRVDIPALSARVAKEVAFAALRLGQQSFAPIVAQAAARYAAIADRFSDTYCAINVAAMARVLGDADKAEKYARRTLMSGTPRTYWDFVTAMEGHLILGEREPALAAARDAAAVEVAEISRAGMVASTRLQLRRLAPSCGALAMELHALLRQKRIAYVSGHLPPQPDLDLSLWRDIEPGLSTAIDQAYVEAEIGAVVCALAAGSDLLMAERALAAEASVHVVLPVPIDVFLERSVLVGDAVACHHWKARFDAVLSKARTVRVLEEDKPTKVRLAFDEAVYVGNRHAAGLALLRSDEWESEAVMICIHDGSPPGSIAGTSRVRADWQALGRRTIPLTCSWRAGRPAMPQETPPTCFGAVLFIWLALPDDHDRHQKKTTRLIDEHFERAESVLRFHLQDGERLERRVLTNQMVGFYIGLRDLMRAQDLAAAISRTSLPGLDGARIVLDFGGVFVGSRLSETRVAALQGARDNIELPLSMVVLTEAFAAEARLLTQAPAPFAQVGLQARKPGVSGVPRAATRYYRSSL